MPVITTTTDHPSPKHVQLASSLRAEQIIAEIIRKKFIRPKTPVIIAIGGPGGTGKSSFAERLSKLLTNSSVLSLDNYKISRAQRKQKQLTGPHPDANMMELVKQHLLALRNGETVSVPIYDRTSGDTGRYDPFTPCDFIIAEGEISTYRVFRHLIDFSIFIDSDLKTQLSTRMTRDIDLHGFSFEKAINVFLNSNLKEYVQHGLESKEWADIYCYSHEHYQLEIRAVTENLLPLLEEITHQVHMTGIQGTIVPVSTPFTKDLSVDSQAFITHLQWLYNKGIRRILVGGTTGEFFSLTAEERITICNLACSFFPGVVLFQAGCDGLYSTLSMIKSAEKAGIHGILCLPPYYYREAPVAGLIDYFTIIADNCKVPLYLYNFPAHTGNTITKDILDKIPHAGLKDSSGELSLSLSTPAYFTGSEKFIIETYKRGGKGYICGFPNVNPVPYVALEHALNGRDISLASEIVTTIMTAKPSIKGVSGIALVKALLSKIIDNYPPFVRPPLVRGDLHPEFATISGMFGWYIQ